MSEPIAGERGGQVLLTVIHRAKDSQQIFLGDQSYSIQAVFLEGLTYTHSKHKMRILCLHGRGTNKDVFQTQLAPVLYNLKQRMDVRFHFVNAPFEVPPAIGVKDQYEGPFFSFFDQQENNYAHILSVGKATARLDLPPEDHCREIRRYGLDPGSWSACNLLAELAQQHAAEPFDGILGFSEGASVAASYILRQTRDGLASFRFAIFLCAQPPFDWRTKGSLLADEISDRVQIPTAHIVGKKDPANRAGLALLNICDPREAKLFEHESGHTIPWSPAITRSIVDEICGVIARANAKKDDLDLLANAETA